MQSNLIKNIERVFTAFNKIDKMPKAVIKYGCLAFLTVFTAGSVAILLNHTLLTYDAHFEMVAKAVVKTSFSIAAEFIIGGLVLDYVFKK